MKDTGERMIPDTVAPSDTLTKKLLQLHLERYRLASTLANGKRVLDIACGSGYGTRYLLDNGAREVVGVDKSSEAVQYARERYGTAGLRFTVAEAESYRDAQFDVIVSFETIEHLPDPPKFLKQMRTLLAPGGLLIVSASTIPTTDIYSFHLHDLDEADLRSLMRQTGFRLVQELLQTNVFSPKETRIAMRFHPATIPFDRIVRRPVHYLMRCWQMLVSHGIDYRNLTVVGEPFA